MPRTGTLHQTHGRSAAAAPQAVLPALPGLPSLTAALDRGWDSQAAKQEPSAPALVRRAGRGWAAPRWAACGSGPGEGWNGAPPLSAWDHPACRLHCSPASPAPPPNPSAQPYTMAVLEEQLKKAYRTVTEGKFR